MKKKKIAKKYFPKEHRPYLIVYPPGSVAYKINNSKVFGANSTIEDLT